MDPSTPPEDVVRAHLAAFSAHDLPAMLATLAPDARFATGRTVVDPADFPTFFGAAMRDLDPSVRITRLLADGNAVACEFIESVTFADGRPDLRRAAFYTVDAAQVTTVQVYDLAD